MPAQFDVFISYPHKEQEAVRALAAALVGEGLAVWMDASGVGAFERIHDRVAGGIAGSRAVVAWYSRSYAASRPCQWELSAAWLCEDGARILVINPEPGDGHILPRELVERSYVGRDKLGDLAAVARAVKGRVAGFASPIGALTSFSHPLHHGRQLTGSNRFVGRGGKLWELHDALSASRSPMMTGEERSVAQLRGFGGVGKSVLAEEYALRFGAAYPGGVFWLKAYGNDDARRAMGPKERDDERLRQLGDFASRLHIPTEGRPPSEIQAALAHLLGADSASGRRSLWIVDDLPSGLTSEALESWLSPHPLVPTLITTRDGSHGSLGRLIELDTLSPEESFALLESHRPVEETEREAARGLLDALGHHALAVEVTASYLAEERSASFAEFVEELRDPGEDVLEQAAELADVLPLDHSPSIVATLSGTIGRLGEPARDLLCLASCVAAAPIPKELVEAVFARLDARESASFRRKKAAKEVERYGLGRREPTPADAISVHTLVARAARRRPPWKGQVERVQAAAVAALTEMMYGTFSLGSILRQGLSITHARAASAPLMTAEEALLLVLVAATDLNRGDIDTGERAARRAHEYCRAEFDEGSLETCRAASCVALALMARGDGEGAREILEAVAPVFERSLPPGDVFHVGALLGLAAVQSELAEARRLCEAALSASAAAYGPDHQVTLNAKSFLARFLDAQGDSRGAMRLQQEVVESRARAAGTLDDVDALTDKLVIAQALMAGGQIEAAAPDIEKAVEVFERELGEENVITLNAQLVRLILLGARGDVSEAGRLAGRLIPRFVKTFGPHNPATLQARCAEAMALLCGDDERGGLAVIEEIVPELEAVLGASHNMTLSAELILSSTVGSEAWNSRDLKSRPH